jgi:hypothetical protein
MLSLAKYKQVCIGFLNLFRKCRLLKPISHSRSSHFYLFSEEVMSQEPCAPGSAHAVHDLGGLEFGPIDRHEHPRTLFEMRVDAMLMLLTNPMRAIFKVDAMRRVVESYTAAEYESLSYYDRWLNAIRKLVIEQEVLTDAEIDQRIVEIKARNLIQKGL